MIKLCSEQKTPDINEEVIQVSPNSNLKDK